MPIELKCRLVATDESDAIKHSGMMIETLKMHVSDAVIVDLNSLPVTSPDEKGCWDVSVSICLVDGRYDPSEELREAKQIAHLIGQHWEMFDDGKTRILESGKGRFSSGFSFMKRAELKFIPTKKVKSREVPEKTDEGYRFFNTLFMWGDITIVISGFLVIAGQMLWWILGNGWPEIPVFLPFALMISFDGDVYAWLVESQSWYGLNDASMWLLRYTPLSLFLLVIGLLLGRFKLK